MKTLQLNYTGRKARIGKICFDDNGRMCVFVNYCTNCKGKVVLSREEAEYFARLYKAESGTLWARILFYVIERRKAVAAPPEQPQLSTQDQEMLLRMARALHE